MKYVAENYEEIYPGKGNSKILIKRDGKSRIAFIEFTPDEKGNFHKVNTAFIARETYLKRKTMLWKGAPSLPGRLREPSLERLEESIKGIIKTGEEKVKEEKTVEEE